MTPETHADIGAFLDGAWKANAYLCYGLLAYSVYYFQSFIALQIFICVTGGLIAVAARRRRAVNDPAKRLKPFPTK